MKRLPGDGIVLRSTLLTVLAFIIAGIGVFVYTYHATAHRATAEIETRLNQLLDTVYSTLSIACFLQDAALAQDVASGLLKNPEVMHVLIQADDVVLSNTGRGDADSTTLPPDEQHPVPFERVVISPFTPDKRVGRIRLTPNPQVIAALRQEEIQRSIAQLLWQLMLVSTAIGTALIVFVARPISRISMQLHTMDPTQGERLSIPSGHDKTEIGKLIRDINHLADRLAVTIAEAREAGQSAEAASEAKSRFLADLSRDIRVPLTTIRQIAGMGARQAASPLDREHFARIETASALLQSTIDEVQDFSQLEAGKLSIENRPCQLDEIIEEAITAIRESAQAKGLELVCRLSPALPKWFSGDPARIRQILVTLLANAVRRSQYGSITLNVLCVEDELWFSVRDEGMGLTQEEIAELFCPFGEKDRAPRQAPCCSRLDMPIAMNLASLMGGTIQVASTPWHGNTFTLQLPCLPTDPPPEA